MALDQCSSWRFEACSCKPTSRDLPSSSVKHRTRSKPERLRSQHTTSSYLTLRHRRSTNTLSRQAPLPSMLIATPCFSSTPVKSTLVNWADSSGRRNTLTGVAMNIRKRRSDRSGRVRLFSPGRPPVAGREERRRFWEAIAAGTASEDAAVGVGVPQAVGTRWFRKAGGMPPSMFGLSAKPLSGRYLSFAEREEIALLRVQGYSMQEVARRLGRVASTISRELRRNAATRSGGLEYRATTAQWHAERAARRPKQAKLARNAALRTYVEERLAGVVVAPSGVPVPGPVVSWKSRRHGPRKDRRWANAWSPEQIARRLPVDFADDATMRISHEAIYQALFVQGRGALRRELTACLRTGRVLRMPRARTRGRGKAFISPEIMISQRPAEAADRAVPGHWEGDLILGLGSSAIGTLVERTTRFTLLLYLPRMAGHGHEARVKNGPALAGHGAEAVRDAITRTIVTLPEQLRRSLTWDQGAEMAQHARLKIEAGVRVYFCDPHSPWQRGTNENTNGLLRQYFPKDRSQHAQRQRDCSRGRRPQLAGPERRLIGRHPQRRSTGFSYQSTKIVLRRPLESAQFASVAFTGVLLNHGVSISMDGKGSWRDNVFVERLWRSVKYEEVYLKAYDSVSEARTSLADYLAFYNQRRPHSSLDR